MGSLGPMPWKMQEWGPSEEAYLPQASTGQWWQEVPGKEDGEEELSTKTPYPGKFQYYKQNLTERRMIVCFLFSTHGLMTEIILTILLSNRIRSADRISVEQLSVPKQSGGAGLTPVGQNSW